VPFARWIPGLPTSIAIYLLIDRRERFARALTKGH
jgi:hypothetical protein